ncbi:MAG: NAD(P)/FAD-dependent oxidoreductase [Planctomycetaceae bacterium]|nr:NAD(P)/FAD-dependent oxidoreductase [Planctomycetaceae bacterium]
MSTQPKTWGIVGGGVLGISLALRLARAGQKVTLIESADHLGGLADAWRLGDLTWDRHYHVTLLSDMWTRGLLRELDLEDQMEWVETKTGFFTDGKLYSLSNSLEFLKFPPLSLLGKLRLGGTIFYASKIGNGRRLEEISVESWLRRWSGKRAFEKLWLPLLRSKLGNSYTKTSALFIWATIARMYAARRSGLKKEMFGYVRGGYAPVMQRFTELLQREGVEILLNQSVRQVRAGAWRTSVVEMKDGNSRTFDNVVLTVPSPVISRLCPDLEIDEKKLFDGVEYQGIVCASVLMKKPLDRFYVTNITDSWVPFTGVIEMTALVDPKEVGGNHLVYLPKYIAPNDPMFERSDDEVREQFVSALERMYPNFRRDDVLAFQVSRVRQVFALPTINYSKRLPPMVTSIPGVFAVNSAHITDGTLNVNETIRLADEAFNTILLRRTKDDRSYEASTQGAAPSTLGAEANRVEVAQR